MKHLKQLLMNNECLLSESSDIFWQFLNILFNDQLLFYNCFFELLNKAQIRMGLSSKYFIILSNMHTVIVKIRTITS